MDLLCMRDRALWCEIGADAGHGWPGGTRVWRQSTGTVLRIRHSVSKKTELTSYLSVCHAIAGRAWPGVSEFGGEAHAPTYLS